MRTTNGNLGKIDPAATTAATLKRYQRIAPFYDCMEKTMEGRFQAGRKKMWDSVQGCHALEVGVGTGRNIEHYPSDIQVTAIDLTPGMLERARRRAHELGKPVELHQMDVQCLDFPDATFDTVVSACVFCSVPDPVLGLQEVLRVTKPGGKVILLEHVRSNHPLLGKIMDVINPMVVRMMGSNINRRTIENVKKAGLSIERVENLGGDGIVKLIFASKTMECS